MTDIPVTFRNTIRCCECVAEMRHLPSESVPFTLTSPPYDQMRDYGGHVFDFSKFESVAQELYRITMIGGVVAWVVRDGFENGSQTCTSSKQKLYFQEIGFCVHNTIVMERKGRAVPGNSRYGSSAPEEAFVLSKCRPRTVNIIRDKPNSTAGDPLKRALRDRDGRLVTKRYPDKVVRKFGQRSNVWVNDSGFNKTTKDRVAFGHPALMPEQMAQDLIISWSRPGDLVFDPLCGAGTTCKMALLNDRRFLGLEIVPDYCEIARERLRVARLEHQRNLDEFFTVTGPCP